MKLKKWPKDPRKIISFCDALKPLKEALVFGYELKRKNTNRTIPYDGYDIGEDEKVTNLSPNVTFQASNLSYSIEDQGRDLADIILGLAFQLGVEQGRRMLRSSITAELGEMYLSLLISEIPEKKLGRKVLNAYRDILGVKGPSENEKKVLEDIRVENRKNK